MAKGRARVWTEEKVKQLYGALNKISKNGHVALSEALTLVQKDTGLSTKQIRDKLRQLGREHNLTLSADELVSQWNEVGSRFMGVTSLKPNRRSPKPSGQAKGRGSQTQKQHSDSDPLSAETRTDSRSSKETQPQSPKSSSGREEHNDIEAQGDKPDEGSADNANGEEANNDIWPASMPAPLPEEIEMIAQWRTFRTQKCYSARPSDQDMKFVIREVVRHIKKGVMSFCEAHPVAHLTTTKMTRSTIELARMLLPVHPREHVEQSLRTLFGDPALSVSLTLRAFVAAAVTQYAFMDFPQFPGLLEASAQKQAQEIFKKYISPAGKYLDQAIEIDYLSNVVEPDIPHLARRYQSELFDVLFSLRAPLEPRFDSPTGQSLADAQAFPYRDRHQSEWRDHIEKAFLEALKLRLRMAKSCCIFEFNMVEQGDEFDNYSMSPQCRVYAKVTPENLVSLCLSPSISSVLRVDAGKGEIAVNVKAKVVMEGFEVDETGL